MDELQKNFEDVLKQNDHGKWTVPSNGLYPHQWLWDSCFTAIGLRHLDPDRAATELKSLLRGQWSNGMIPHMIFSPQKKLMRDYRLWHSEKVDLAPKDVHTSGITQPPLLAEATSLVAEKLSPDAKKELLATMVPAIIHYHEWLYRERDPQANGLVLLLHPWETGLDNSPSWMKELQHVHTPFWVRLMDMLAVDSWFNWLRRDTKHVPAEQRMKTSDLLRLYHAAKDLQRRQFDLKKTLVHKRRHFIVESLSFNSILIRNNQILVELAQEAGVHIPPWLLKRFEYAKAALTLLCDPKSGVCYHRNFDSHKTEEEPTISVFMPLYSGAITGSQAEQLVRHLKNESTYWLKYPVPSVPKNSPFFSEKRYWQGPTWINTNWLIIDGLKRYGFETEAAMLHEKTLELVKYGGAFEYFSPLDGKGYGSRDFSWTAALSIDLINN